MIATNKLELIWSYILDFENQQNPFIERNRAIGKWKKYSSVDIEASNALIELSKSIITRGIKAKDALHIASAIVGEAEYFITTDDGILKKLNRFDNIVILSPTDFIKIIDTE
ncbi:MAG: hypothetical protein K9H16_05885 [Bacteroidales bacterium]|nr:hypothetical protein [Bacteroidales bacterium]